MWEKTIQPPDDGFASAISFQLKKMSDRVVKATYDPLVQFPPEMFDPQDITIYPMPMFIQSRGYSLYWAKDIKQFKGYLSKVEFVPSTEGDLPEAQITITPIDPKRCCCPICGHEFDEVKEINICPTQHYGRQEFIPDELITDDDDYAWCQ